MMPSMLMKFGLVEALGDFFNTINGTGTLTIDFQHYGMEEKLSKSTELVLYRVIQELINNIIKHSQAKEAIVQFTRNADTLVITVEDDGQGFDPKSGGKSSGLGMKNLENRINYLKGDLTIESESGMGTSVYIEIDLKRTDKS
jgi:signal transduction histidine kinase